ncbi:hypothetical protein [Lyngbya confervoides]|uniref:Bacteriocin n=1 Tax=Lyngbya confervoides BDU141951 TaxID=1574623 RepID=A0ABD4T5H2_9CYAN|nr:hypothetical protein [Lyngbya confervoides]MCM1983738.1 hypothetical protein [Lyngbya confervoides BDU141951]
MSNIRISDLQNTGYELFSDPESYLKDLSMDETIKEIGGKPKTATVGSLIATGVSTPVCMGALVGYTIWG